MDDTSLKLFIGLNRTLNRMHQTTDVIFRRYGLTRGQFAVLEALYHKGDLSIGEVQAHILTTSGNIPVIVRNLEKEKLLEKTVDANDRRRILLHLTEKGRSLIAQVFPENAACIRNMMSTWSEEEQQMLLQAMKKFGGRSI